MSAWPSEIPVDEYIRLFILEKTLRCFVRNELSKICEKWWRQRIPGDVWSAAEERKRDEEKRLMHSIDLHPLWYVDFYDYVKIIVRKNNWEEVFKAVFINKEGFKTSMEKLVPIRNKVAHMRPLSIREKKSLDAWSEELLAPIWRVYNERYVGSAEKLVDKQDYEGAVKILRKGYEETDGDPWIAYKLGELYQSLGEFQESKYWLEIAAEYLPLPRYRKLANQKLLEVKRKTREDTMKICPECGSKISVKDKYCRICGFKTQ